jgi:TolB-like protein/class 3 adenylate cyclase/tetratricopeptide (TPR) repeat protein
MERRLVAIMATDVVGYSRLMERDEAGTLAALKIRRKQVLEPLVAHHQGRIFKVTGDGVLVEFGSAVNAIQCAIALQQEMHAANRDLPEDWRIVLRVGVNIGDVMVEGDDLYGDGVNVAARLEAMAEPGRVLLSQTVYDHVRGKVQLQFDDLGFQSLKNIAEPVHAYCALPNLAGFSKPIVARKRPASSWKRPTLVGAALTLSVGIAILAWLRPWETRSGPGLVLPNKPSIAVLPFVNMSGDPQQEYFADGITEDLITDLSQVSGLFIIARNSSFAYKGKVVDVRQVSRELGVRYVLEGSIQRSADQVRINAQLIDATTDGHIWAERYDGLVSDVFSLQDKVTQSVADSLALRLTAAGELYQSQRETSVPAAYDSFLRGWEHYRRTTPEDYAKAIPYFGEALKLDPNYGRAQAAVAMIYANSYAYWWTGSLGIPPPEALSRARQYVDKAKKHPSALTHQVAGYVLLVDSAPFLALAEFKEAIALDPSDSWSYALIGYALISAGRPGDSIQYIETAIRLDPHPPSVFLYYLGLAQFSLEQFGAAASSLEQATRLNPDDQFPFLALSASCGYLGRKNDALSATARYNKIVVRLGGVPLSINDMTVWTDLFVWQLVDNARFQKGLRLAGVPEFLDRSEFAAQNQLTAAEVRSLFFGRRLHGHNFWSGEERAASLATDGAITLSGKWGTLDLGGGPVTGHMRIEDKELCLQFGVVSYCGIMLRNPDGTKAMENQFIWASGSGGYPFSPVE